METVHETAQSKVISIDAFVTRERWLTLLVVAICIFWIFPGLFGRDLWKADEPYSFGLVSHIMNTGDWVVPTLAGEPFMEKPPVLYITAAQFAKVFSPVLPLHEGARLAAGFYVLVALLFVGLTGREIIGRSGGALASLALVGCIGLQDQGHRLITDTALLAGFAIAFYGLAISRRRDILGGFLAGTGFGIAFLAKGLLGPGLIGITAVILPFVSNQWRTRRYLSAAGIAIAFAIPWVVIWPLSLYLRSPRLFNEWLFVQNFGRFFNQHGLGPKNKFGFYFMILPWYAWPALPLALWGVLKRGKGWLTEQGLRLPLAGFLVMLTILSVASDARSLYAMPMLVPLSILAADGVMALPEKSLAWLNGAVTAVICILVLLLWTGWIAMVTGFPEFLAHRLLAECPNFVPSVKTVPFTIAIAYTIGCILLFIFAGNDLRSALLRWSGGITFGWALLMTLWLPWLDFATSYRPVFESLSQAIPDRTHCIASRGLGESERALAEYYAGIVTERVEVKPDLHCDLMLVQIGSLDTPLSPGPGWKKLWEGGRPSRLNERFALWEKEKVKTEPTEQPKVKQHKRRHKARIEPAAAPSPEAEPQENEGDGAN